MNIKGAPFRAKLLKGFLVLWVACSFPITSFSNELRSTETDGTVQFTGVYEPLDPPVPSPPTGPVPRPPQDTVKPGGTTASDQHRSAIGLGDPRRSFANYRA